MVNMLSWMFTLPLTILIITIQTTIDLTIMMMIDLTILMMIDHTLLMMTLTRLRGRTNGEVEDEG